MLNLGKMLLLFDVVKTIRPIRFRFENMWLKEEFKELLSINY